MRQDRTISLGYAQGDVRLGDGNRKDIRLDDDLKGINVKYLHKLSEMFGAIGSFTYTDLNYDYLNNNVKIGDASFDYYSLMVGPSVHFNEFFSMYALLGIGHGNAKASVLGYGKKRSKTLWHMVLGCNLIHLTILLLMLHTSIQNLKMLISVHGF